MASSVPLVRISSSGRLRRSGQLGLGFHITRVNREAVLGERSRRKSSTPRGAADGVLVEIQAQLVRAARGGRRVRAHPEDSRARAQSVSHGYEPPQSGRAPRGPRHAPASKCGASVASASAFNSCTEITLTKSAADNHRAGGPRRRWADMVGSGGVIAGRLGAERSHENAARMADLVEQRRLGMLRCSGRTGCELDGLVGRADQNDGAVLEIAWRPRRGGRLSS